MPLPLIFDAFWVGSSAFVVQTFFAWRIWKISQERNWILPLITTTLSVTQYVVILWVMSFWARHKLLVDIEGVLPIGYLWLSSSLAADFSITIGIIYYLGIKPRNSELGRGARLTFLDIIVRTIQANVYSLLSQVLTFALFRVRNIGLYFFLIDFTITNVYAFSVITSLNTRKQAKALFNNSDSQSGPSSGVFLNTFSITRQEGPRENTITVHTHADSEERWSPIPPSEMEQNQKPTAF
ncbi:hypothetical protein GYMLUDRAFT_805033 [Collybiopsis luxurians FD-317 M1]|nr:hypothetical protein GYMLUDRAFT_805033 [Collybiopsis luxurians FD-317 M1]